MTNPEQVATEMSQQGTFNFLERLQGANLPTDSVNVYFDQASGYRRRRLLEKLADTTDKDAVAAIEAELAEVNDKLAESLYIFKLAGISTEDYDKLVDESRETFPVEHEETTNFIGQKVRVEVESPERDALFTTLLLAASITSVTSPEGEVDSDITPEKVKIMRGAFPLDGMRKLINTVNDLRMAVEWMDSIQDEDFSPRP